MEVLLYEGSIAVASGDYVHIVYDEAADSYTQCSIENLDVQVSSLPQIAFKLDYPFEKEFEGKLVTAAGPTLRQVIDAIRGGFATRYEGTSQEEHAYLSNKLVTGPYGRAFHAIEDLVIESITLDTDTGQLEIGIGS